MIEVTAGIQKEGERMPPKERTLPEMYVIQPDGKRIKIGDIQAVNFSNDDDYDYCNPEGRLIVPSKLATFTVTWNPTTDMIYLLIHGRLPSNNWLKMHGFPLRRKRK